MSLHSAENLPGGVGHFFDLVGAARVSFHPVLFTVCSHFNRHEKKVKKYLAKEFQPANLLLMGRHKGKLGRQIETLPAGSVISVLPEQGHLVRYHARPIRPVKLRMNLRTGKRDVWLGEFFHNSRPITNRT